VNDEVRAAIDNCVADHARRAGAPSCAAAVVSGGRVEHHASASIDGHPVLTASTQSRIASMTKSFTAAAILLLRDDGWLALDDPLARHVPAAVGLGRDGDPPITIRHLLTMNAGIVTDNPWGDRQMDRTDSWFDEVLRSGLTFAHGVGRTMEYSNTSFALLGRVIRDVTGDRPQRFIDERLLRPLGMTHTSWEHLADGSWLAPFRRQDGSVVAEPAPAADGVYAPMAGLWSTAADLAVWVHFLQSAFTDRCHAPDVMSAASRREMQRVHCAYAKPILRDEDGAVRQIGIGYGMGLVIAHHTQLGTLAMHSGGLPGYGSNMRWLVDGSIGVVTMANLTYAPMADLAYHVLQVIHDHGGIDAAPVPISGELCRALDTLVAMFSSWDDECLDALFADNVGPDESFDRRRAAIAALGVRAPLRVEQVVASSAAEADAVITDGVHQWTLQVLLSPEHPTRVQWYAISRRE
jgi:CubicO group peptidase (beta-lactamase class C family)